MERPHEQKGNFQLLRSTRKIGGSAEEVYQDLLLGNICKDCFKGRRRWEKRLSNEEVLISISDMPNELDVSNLASILKGKRRNNENTSSVILKEWRKMKKQESVHSCKSTSLKNSYSFEILFTNRSSNSKWNSCDISFSKEQYRTCF